MVPVAANHAPDVIDRNLLPGLVSDVLPARDLFQYEEADEFAGVRKMTRLRIVRRADDVAFELVAEDLCVAALGASRHRLPNKGERLMTVESSQLDDLAVQLETVIRKLGFPETKTARVFIDRKSTRLNSSHLG